MKTFKNFLKEEVFYWYIIKGTSEKGKVAHVGTERQLKLKIRKSTFPSGHILLKSRKDLKIGDVWKGSMGVSEEVEIDEGTFRGKPSLFDKEDGTQEKWMKEIDKGIKAEVVFTHKSAIGKEDIMIGISLDPKKNWTNNIYQNSRYSQFHLDPGGGLQQFAKHFRLDKFRKTKVKTPKAAVDKINSWISKVESIPYKP